MVAIIPSKLGILDILFVSLCAYPIDEVFLMSRYKLWVSHNKHPDANKTLRARRQEYYSSSIFIYHVKVISFLLSLRGEGESFSTCCNGCGIYPMFSDGSQVVGGWKILNGNC
jgi:hypothetical protein